MVLVVEQLNCPMNLSKLIKSLTSFLAEDEGTTSVEYAVMISLILVALMGGFYAMSEATKDSFQTSADAIVDAGGN